MKNRIRELREEFAMTQVRLSIELGVTQETISAYEIGRHFPSVKSLLDMSKLFHASIDYILGLSDVRFPVKSGHFSDDTAEELYQKMLGIFSALNPELQAVAVAQIEILLKLQKTE